MRIRLFCTEISILLFQMPIHAQTKWEKIVNRSSVFLERPECDAIARNCHGMIKSGRFTVVRAKNLEVTIITIKENTPTTTYMPILTTYKPDRLRGHSVKKIKAKPCSNEYCRPTRPDVRWWSPSQTRICFGTSDQCYTDRVAFFKWISILNEWPHATVVTLRQPRRF